MGSKNKPVKDQWSKVPTKKQQQAKCKEQVQARRQRKAEGKQQRDGCEQQDWLRWLKTREKDKMIPRRQFNWSGIDRAELLIAGPSPGEYLLDARQECLREVEWWHWRSRQPSVPRCCSEEQVALTESEARCLATFLHHQQSFIVVVVVTFWRKLLLRVADSDESSYAYTFPEESSWYPPLRSFPRYKKIPSEADGVQAPDHHGVCGDLAKAVENYLPNFFTPGNDDHHRFRYRIPARGFNKFRLFFYFSVHTGQTDVVALILQYFDIDLNVGFGEGGTKYRWDWATVFQLAVIAGHHSIMRLLCTDFRSAAKNEFGPYDVRRHVYYFGSSFQDSPWLGQLAVSGKAHRLETLRVLLLPLPPSVHHLSSTPAAAVNDRSHGIGLTVDETIQERWTSKPPRTALVELLSRVPSEPHFYVPLEEKEFDSAEMTKKRQFRFQLMVGRIRKQEEARVEQDKAVVRLLLSNGAQFPPPPDTSLAGAEETDVNRALLAEVNKWKKGGVGSSDKKVSASAAQQ